MGVSSHNQPGSGNGESPYASTHPLVSILLEHAGDEPCELEPLADDALAFKGAKAWVSPLEADGTVMVFISGEHSEDTRLIKLLQDGRITYYATAIGLPTKRADRRRADSDEASFDPLLDHSDDIDYQTAWWEVVQVALATQRQKALVAAPYGQSTYY